MTNVLTVILYLKITQFHSVTKVDSNSNSANAKSALPEHEPLTLKVVDNDDVWLVGWSTGFQIYMPSTFSKTYD